MKVLVTCEGYTYFQRAISKSTWGACYSTNTDAFSASATLKTYENKDGYNGYYVEVFVSYEMFKLTKEEAIDNLTICMALRERCNYQHSYWGIYEKDGAEFLNCSTHHIILADGSLLGRSDE